MEEITRKKIRFTKEEDKFLLDNYNKIGIMKCCKALNRNKGSVQKRRIILKIKNNQKIQDSFQRMFPVDTKEKAYFLGFLWADGYVPINRPRADNRICISIQEEDGNAIKDIFCKNINFYVNFSPKLKPTWKNILHFRVSDKLLHKKLEELDYGIKSFAPQTKVLKEIPENLHYMFWRGYIDGDGSIATHSNRVTASSNIKQDWTELENLCRRLNIENFKIFRMTSKKNHKYSVFSIRKLPDCEKILNYIYQNFEEDKIGLVRKYYKFLLLKDRKKKRESVKHNKNNRYNIKFTLNGAMVIIRDIKEEKDAKDLDCLIRNFIEKLK